ncbi:MAG TPA: hypothetical protein PKC29_13635 [Thermodesulfobacteriota bacterium]|nr:hypothetical protein [Thermodesulfobacteriota bacterium]
MGTSNNSEHVTRESVMHDLKFIGSEIQKIRQVIMGSSKAIGKIKRENSNTASFEIAIEECVSRIDILYRIDQIEKIIETLEGNL